MGPSVQSHYRELLRALDRARKKARPKGYCYHAALLLATINQVGLKRAVKALKHMLANGTDRHEDGEAVLKPPWLDLGQCRWMLREEDRKIVNRLKAYRRRLQRKLREREFINWWKRKHGRKEAGETRPAQK